jgi:hypothetical protein
MAEWNSDDNMWYREQEFGRAPYGDPFYIPNNWSPETGYGDINIITGFNDRVQKDLDWWRNSDYRDLLFEEAVAKDGSYIPVSTHEERAASNNNWWSHNPAAGQAFLDNINNPEGYNIWKQKADSERDAFTPFWNLMKILGVGKQPTYEEQANLYYSPIANKSEAIQKNIWNK